jgi:hypothetical protein
MAVDPLQVVGGCLWIVQWLKLRPCVNSDRAETKVSECSSHVAGVAEEWLSLAAVSALEGCALFDQCQGEVSARTGWQDAVTG